MDRNENHLILNLETNTILIGIDITESGASNWVNVSIGYHEEIRDIRPVGSDNLIICSDRGTISFSKYTLIKSELIFENNLGLSKSEEVSAITTDPQNRYLAVFTSIGLSAARIFLVSIKHGLQLLSISNLNQNELNISPLSYFQAVDMNLEISGHPVLIGIQYDGDNLLISYLIKDGQLIRINEPWIYHSHIVANCCFNERAVWSIDKSGVIKQLSIIQ